MGFWYNLNWQLHRVQTEYVSMSICTFFSNSAQFISDIQVCSHRLCWVYKVLNTVWCIRRCLLLLSCLVSFLCPCSLPRSLHTLNALTEMCCSKCKGHSVGCQTGGTGQTQPGIYSHAQWIEWRTDVYVGFVAQWFVH